MIEDKEEHPRKASSPTVVTLSGIVTDTSDLQKIKQSSPISVKPAGISTEVPVSSSPPNMKTVEGGGETFAFFVFGC